MRGKKVVCYNIKAPQSICLLPVSSQVIYKNQIDLNPIASLDAELPCSNIQAAILVTQAMAPDLFNCSFLAEWTSFANIITIYFLQASWEKIIDRYTFFKTVFVKSESRLESLDQLIFKKVSGHFAAFGIRKQTFDWSLASLVVFYLINIQHFAACQF